MKHLLSLSAVLALLWWILSGSTSFKLVGLGIVSVLFTAYVAQRLQAVDRESLPLHMAKRLLGYWPYLLWQIVLSNIAMSRLILSRNPDLDPRIIRVNIRQKSDLGKVVLGNSITLTPGTVTLDFGEDDIEVYAINEEAANGVLSGEMDNRVPVYEEKS